MLKHYDVVYLAGEWIDRCAVTRLDAWVRAGGVLYACGGIGYHNELDRPEPAMLALLGRALWEDDPTALPGATPGERLPVRMSHQPQGVARPAWRISGG